MSLSPDSGPPGTYLTVVGGGGRPPCQTVYVSFDQQVIGAGEWSPDGSIYLGNLRIPGSASAGRQLVSLSCDSQTRARGLTSSTFDVLAVSSHPTALDTSVVRPDQVGLDLPSVSRSAGIALALWLFLLLLALAIESGFAPELFNRSWEDNKEEFRERLPDWLRRHHGRAGQLLIFLLFVVFGGLLTALTDHSFGFTWSFLWLTLGAAIAFVVMTLGFTAADAWSGWRDHDRKIGVNVVVGSVVVAIVCALVSRLWHLMPPYLYGLIGGWVVLPKLSHRRESFNAVIASVVTLGLALTAWLLQGLVSSASQTAPPALVAEAALSVIFVAGISSLAFGLVPLAYMPGKRIWALHKGVWSLLFALSWFLLLKLVIYPYAGSLTEHGPHDLTPLWIAFGGFGAASLLFWASCRIMEQRTEERRSADAPDRAEQKVSVGGTPTSDP